jgi:uncharacterized membrane protein
MKKEIKLGVVTILITIVVSLLRLIKGWEIPAFALLTYILFYFSLFFVQYVDEQKNVNSIQDTEGDK